ncbi:MAG: aldehyde dehydrogenase family protein, partial [Haliea sp.]
STPLKAGWELQACIDQAYMCAAMCHQSIGEIFPSTIPGRENQYLRVPVGVVGVISPWNFPLVLSLRSVLPALAMGNAVVMKPDLHSSVTGGLLISALMEEAGLPESVCSLVLGGAEIGQAIVEHSDVKMVAFTGSSAVGRQIGEICGRLLKKTALELGGNNAFVVLDDADITAASSCAAWGSFLHQGQICMQSGRHIIHESIADLYIEYLKKRAESLPVGNPHLEDVQVGPLINDKQAERVERLVKESVAMGAVVVCGGKRSGRYFPPTVIKNVTVDMPIFNQEIFGPVAPVVTFKTDSEAVGLVNDSDYGLAAAIHSRDLGRARGIAQQLQVGMIHINDQTVNNEYHVPFGGVKASGSASRFGGPANMEEFTEKRWISSIETPLVYPF